MQPHVKKLLITAISLRPILHQSNDKFINEHFKREQVFSDIFPCAYSQVGQLLIIFTVIYTGLHKQTLVTTSAGPFAIRRNTNKQTTGQQTAQGMSVELEYPWKHKHLQVETYCTLILQ